MPRLLKSEPPAYRVDHEFTHGALKLVLKYGAGDLRQRDIEKFMAAIRRSDLGESPPEHAGKVLRAAIQAGWVIEPALKVEKDHDDVADLPPAHAFWYAAQIDAVYRECMTVPLA